MKILLLAIILSIPSFVFCESGVSELDLFMNKIFNETPLTIESADKVPQGSLKITTSNDTRKIDIVMYKFHSLEYAPTSTNAAPKCPYNLIYARFENEYIIEKTGKDFSQYKIEDIQKLFGERNKVKPMDAIYRNIGYEINLTYSGKNFRFTVHFYFHNSKDNQNFAYIRISS